MGMIIPRTNLCELKIGKKATVMDKQDAKHIIAMLGVGQINKYKGYTQPTPKVGQQSGPCIDITEQYKREHGYA